MSTKGAGGVIYTNNMIERRGMRMENPFVLKFGQVFTGFGFGCGVGIGYGSPLNLGAIPALSQVMVATRGATDAFSGVHRHVNNTLRKLGVNNIKAGIGCGVGFGHGFGFGLAVKPGVLHQIQSNFFQVTTRLMTKLAINPDSNQNSFQRFLQTGTSMVKEPSHEKPAGSISTLSDGTLKYSSRTEEVLDNFLRNPVIKEERSPLHEQVLKHQGLIEELMEENKKLRRILVEEPSKFQSNFTSRSKSSCTECFECRRKQRKR